MEKFEKTPCSECEGTGRIEVTQECMFCEGSGKIRHLTCAVCGGEGTDYVTTDCPICQGDKYVSTEFYDVI